MSEETPETKEEETKEEILVWKKDTWGNFGQHDNTYTFVIDLETAEMKPVFEFINVRHVNKDSRKNFHRYTYASVTEIITKLQGKILKVIHDYASSSKRRISTIYYLVTPAGLKELNAETGLRDGSGFYDKLILDNKTIIVRKDKVEVK